MKGKDFEEWFQSKNWWKENIRYDDFRGIWARMERAGLPREEIAHILNLTISAMRDEYGD